MKILVLSDSHGAVDNMAQAVEREQPDAVFHLGDCWSDAEKLRRRFPNLTMEQVPGNCDYRSFEPAERMIFLEDARILLCHGHTLGVKSSLLRAGFKAEEERLNLLCFGHTHRPLVDLRGNTWFVNPGSIGDYFKPTYALVTITPGKIDPSIHPL